MSTSVSRMTVKGQITIPAEIRHKVGLSPRDLVEIDIVDGEIIVRPVRSQLLAGFGAVTPRSRPENWTAVREEVERALAEEVMREG